MDIRQCRITLPDTHTVSCAKLRLFYLNLNFWQCVKNDNPQGHPCKQLSSAYLQLLYTYFYSFIRFISKIYSMLIERQLKDDSMCTFEHVAEKCSNSGVKCTQRVSKLKKKPCVYPSAHPLCLVFRKEGYSTNLPVPVLDCKLIAERERVSISNLSVPVYFQLI